MIFFEYKVQYFNAIDEIEKNAKGLVCGACFTDAMKTLVEYYGECEINQVTLTPMTDGDCNIFEQEDK